MLVPGRVEPHDPVGLAAAAGCGVERVVVGKRPQAPKGVADGTRGQGVEPQPPGRLGCRAGQLQDVAEDQLAFPAGVRGADQLIGGAEEMLDDGELLAGAFLIQKLEGPMLGGRMPANGPPYLQQATVDVIRQWIQDGALP